jgi:uncharacterized protein YcfL
VRKTSHALLALVALMVAALALAGCSSTSGSQGGPTTVQVSIHGDTITPNGDRIKVGVGQPVTLKIGSDRDGELHVHSTPEQHLEYSKGSTTRKITIDKPGIVDVEDHKADVVVVSLEVS